MDVSVNGSITNLTQSFQYSNLRFIGTLTNFSGNSLNTNTFTLYNQSSVNYQTNFVLTTSIKNIYYKEYMNSFGTVFPNESSSITHGDINGIGQDALIASYYIQNYNNFDSELSVLEWNKTSESFNTWGSNISLGLYYPVVQAINFRGTGPDQILIAGFSSLDTTYITLKIINFSPNGNEVYSDSQRTISNITLTGLDAQASSLTLEKGDVFGYGPQQFLIYGDTINGFKFASLYEYNLSSNSVSLLHKWVDSNLGKPLLTSFLNNNIDQVIIPCITFCFDSSNDNPANTFNQAGFIYGDAQDNFVKLAYFPYGGLFGAGAFDGDSIIKVLNIENDYFSLNVGNILNLVALVFQDQPYTLINSTTGLYIPYPIAKDNSGNLRIYNLGTGNLNNFNSMPVLLSDVDFDSVPEILIPDMFTSALYNIYPNANFVGSGGYRIYLMRNNTIINQDATETSFPNNNNLFDAQFTPINTSIADYWSSIGEHNFTYYASLSNERITGDFFGQAIKLVHQSTYITESRPTVIVVLAAPPIVSTIKQGTGNSFTQFGKTASQSVTGELSVGFNEGMSIGLGVKSETSFGVGVEELGFEFSDEVKASFDASFTKSYSNTSTLDTQQDWATGAQGNGVVFASILYKNWNYTAINGPLNGKTLTFTYPVSATIQKFNTGFFDQLFPGYNINNGTFGSTQIVGQPNTYPTEAQIPTITSGSPFVYKSAQQGVSEGHGYDTVQIDVSNELGQSNSQEYTIGVSNNLQVVAGGVEMTSEFSTGASYGSTLTVTMGKGTVYYGAVQDIQNSNDYLNYQYNYGLFAYVLKRTDLGISYQVINYWVQPLGPKLVSGTYVLENVNNISPFSNSIFTLEEDFRRIII